jgi:hypothetical protein
MQSIISRPLVAVPTLIALALMSGCGSGGSTHTSPPGTAIPTTPSTTAALARPLYARCGTRRFAAPVAQRTSRPGAKIQTWRVTYLYPPVAPVVHPGQTTNVLILERPPSGPRGNIRGGHDIVIAGRNVSLLKTRGGAATYAAQWKTRAAHYVMLVNGSSTATLARLVACLP